MVDIPSGFWEYVLPRRYLVDKLTAEQMIGRWLFSITSKMTLTMYPDCVEDRCPALDWADDYGYFCRVLNSAGVDYPWRGEFDIPDDITPWCPRYVEPEPDAVFENCARWAAKQPLSTNRQDLDAAVQSAIGSAAKKVREMGSSGLTVEDWMDSPTNLHDPKDERSI